MIRLDNYQHGHQILFIDASMGIPKEKNAAGLVGPNGAGTTLFRMIAGAE